MNRSNEASLLQLKFDWPLSDAELDLFSRYVNLLENYTDRVNLISVGDVPRIVSKHIQESLQFLRIASLSNLAVVLDLGSGAGFPGVPMKIMNLDIRMTLVDSKKKKCLFLSEVVEQLHLTGVDVVCDRVENLSTSGYCDKCDLVVARTVADLSRLWQWSQPLLKRGGKLITLKGGDLDKELGVFRKIYADGQIIRPLLKNDRGPGKDKKFIMIQKSVL
jgi:16S rRNA (guanine527-N7)-methyltransferase